MFKKLKLRLTLINIVVVILITLFLGVGIFFMMFESIHRQSDQLISLVISDVGSGAGPNDYRHQRKWFNFFFVKMDNQGKIFETSQNVPVSTSQMQSLVEDALTIPEDKGQVGHHQRDGSYRFVKAPLKNGKGTVIVFLNTEAEEDLIGHLFGAFSVTSLGGIALTLLGSLFMANKAIVPIKNSWEQQKNFVADASHELRTPIAVIQTNLEVLKNCPDEKMGDLTAWLENIESENKVMAKLVDDLLFLARADSSQLQMNKENFNLNEAIAECLSPFVPVAHAKGIRLNKELDQEIFYFGDKMKIRQLIAILIDNAIQYTSEGGEIELQVQESETNVHITVRDSGDGISEEDQKRIFERFYRADKARSRESGGTGLGLSIADWIVREHHGTIQVASTLGQGTTFTIQLPQKRGMA